MPIAKELREAYFSEEAKKLVELHSIRKGRSSDFMSSLRIGYLFSNVAIKMYGPMLGQDALIGFRDWAIAERIQCAPINEQEVRGGKAIKNPYANPSRRLYESLSFQKFTTLLNQILCPPRQPLTGRTPVVADA